ncbi:hypothetical protein [Streptomyces sp. NBC_01565]|uniref:hypothetical protein n=1 Tax=unclassified Streptomyces TaxID=2593676 RepID=UPI00224CB759|nr:hypothetical protein [Streptomyces sp. NBC_01565]MCX4539463.1 hypothetical protein [Streptomyces sp. NBC_01565]
MNRTHLRLAVVAASAVLALGSAGLGAAAAQAAPTTPAAASASAVSSDTETIIHGTSGLGRGQTWSSPDGSTFLAQQTDGHVVLYHNGVAIWTARGTYGIGTSFYMQADGNLVAYDAAMRPLWNSGTDRHPGAHLAIQNAGNMVVYAGSTPIWWSNFRPGGPVDPGDGECRPTPHQLCP